MRDGTESMGYYTSFWYWTGYTTACAIAGSVVPLAHTQQSHQLTPGCGESAVFAVGRQARDPGQLVLKTPEPPDAFQQSLFKGQVREGSACMMSSRTVL